MLFCAGLTATTSDRLRVSVSEDGTGSRVEIVGNAGDASAAAAVQRVLAALRERLS